VRDLHGSETDDYLLFHHPTGVLGAGLTTVIIPQLKQHTAVPWDRELQHKVIKATSYQQ